jgi:hypothetical protein
MPAGKAQPRAGPTDKSLKTTLSLLLSSLQQLILIEQRTRAPYPLTH